MAKSPEVSIDKLIAAVTDENSFIKTFSLMRGRTELGDAFGEGVSSGFASISDFQVGIFGIDGNILGGALGERGAAKIAKLIADCVKTHSPVVGVIDTEGARFAEGASALEGYDAVFSALAAARGEVPVVLVVRGRCFGMMNFALPMADCVIALGEPVIVSSSPLILAAKTGLETEKAVSFTSRVKSGLFDFVVSGAAELKKVLSNLIDFFTSCRTKTEDDPNRVCKALKTGCPVKMLIGEAFDKNSFTELGAGSRPEVITGLARLNGSAVGVIAVETDGLTAAAARKISRHIGLLRRFDLPAVTLVNAAGTVNDIDEEYGGLFEETSKLIGDYRDSSLTRVTLVYGKAVGLGFSAFAARGAADHVLAWDSAYIGMLDGEASAALLYGERIGTAPDPAKAMKKLTAAYAKENAAAGVVAESGALDNVIPPSLTRQYLIAAVEAYMFKE